ncbi:hypothetical protein T265_12751, partial [Opisthorchis viverrini]
MFQLARYSRSQYIFSILMSSSLYETGREDKSDGVEPCNTTDGSDPGYLKSMSTFKLASLLCKLEKHTTLLGVIKFKTLNVSENFSIVRDRFNYSWGSSDKRILQVSINLLYYLNPNCTKHDSYTHLHTN